jgi:hypothetical protein
MPDRLPFAAGEPLANGWRLRARLAAMEQREMARLGAGVVGLDAGVGRRSDVGCVVARVAGRRRRGLRCVGAGGSRRQCESNQRENKCQTSHAGILPGCGAACKEEKRHA